MEYWQLQFSLFSFWAALCILWPSLRQLFEFHAVFIQHLINTNFCPLCWSFFFLVIYTPSLLPTDAFCSHLLIYEGQGLWASFHKFKAFSSVPERYFVGTQQNWIYSVCKSSSGSISCKDGLVIVLADQIINDNAVANTQEILTCSLSTIVMQWISKFGEKMTVHSKDNSLATGPLKQYQDHKKANEAILLHPELRSGLQVLIAGITGRQRHREVAVEFWTCFALFQDHQNQSSTTFSPNTRWEWDRCDCARTYYR